MRRLFSFLGHHDVNENERKKGQADADQGVYAHGDGHRRFASGDLLPGLQINESDLKREAAVQARFLAHINMSCQFEADIEPESHRADGEEEQGPSEGMVTLKKPVETGHVKVGHDNCVQERQPACGLPEDVRSWPV